MLYHITWSTYGSWLPGDPRGFRTRHHRTHVEGDYKNPPPPGTYDGLHAYAKGALTKPPVVLPIPLRPVAGQTCLEQFQKEWSTVHAISVGGEHVHAALEAQPQGLKALVGRAKKVPSHRIRAEIPGQVWAEGCHVMPIRDKGHWLNVLKYIRTHQFNSWVWVRNDLPGT